MIIFHRTYCVNIYLINKNTNLHKWDIYNHIGNGIHQIHEIFLYLGNIYFNYVTIKMNDNSTKSRRYQQNITNQFVVSILLPIAEENIFFVKNVCFRIFPELFVFVFIYCVSFFIILL